MIGAYKDKKKYLFRVDLFLKKYPDRKLRPLWDDSQFVNYNQKFLIPLLSFIIFAGAELW